MGFLIPGSLVRVQPGVLKSTGKPVLFSFHVMVRFVDPASILKNPQFRTGIGRQISITDGRGVACPGMPVRTFQGVESAHAASSPITWFRPRLFA